MRAANPPNEASPWLWLGLSMAYCMLMASYFVLRYHGLWIDTDSAVLTQAAQAMGDEGTLIPQRFIYGTGYAYQSVTTFLSAASGISVADLQYRILPVLGMSLWSSVLFLFFRECTGSAPFAALGTILLYSHPDFLYVSLRGSHEKMTWPLVALALIFFLSSLRAKDVWQSALYVVLFYLSALALMTTNFFFASSFVIAILTSLVIGLVAARWIIRQEQGRQIARQLQRYIYVIASLSVLLVLVLFYIYPPAQDSLQTMKSLQEKIASLIFGESTRHNPYAIVSFGWVSRWAYLGLTSINYLLIITSLIGLFVVVRNAIYRPTIVVITLFYLSFSLLFFCALVADLTGSIGANLQLRIMPAYMLFTVAMTLLAFQWLYEQIGVVRRVAAFAMPVLLVFFSINALLKSTNEPALSNYWIFYLPSEQQGLAWSDQHLRGQPIWMDFDAVRLAPLWRQEFSESTQGNRADTGEPEPITRTFFVSQPVRLWGARLGQALPVPADALRIYDNGEAELYHLRPLTPYQR
ncbi:hypothetical protein F8S13_26420 [Chloroflexia bacterium SDU3-3]|nr:hypothetical protein F8S13_26420 [Chloroflexia bacterium SDU3-3]